MVKGYKDPVYAALQARYDRLTSPVNAEVEQKFDYLRSFTLAEFEEIVDSQINYALSKEGNLYGKVVLNGKDIIISISNDAKSQLVKNKIITDEALVASVKPTKSAIPVNSKPGLYVVLTAKNGKVPFWMMTYYDPTVTDIDLSEVPVANLSTFGRRTASMLPLKHMKMVFCSKAKVRTKQQKVPKAKVKRRHRREYPSLLWTNWSLSMTLTL